MSGRGSVASGAAVSRDPDYRVDRFRYDEAANEMVCPEGKRLRYRTEHRLPGGRKILTWAARGEDCRDCAARKKCCPQLKISKRGRSVSVQLSDPAVEAFDEKMQTPEAQAIYRRRAPLIEFPNAWIKTEAQAQTLLDARSGESALRSLVGRSDLQLAANVPASSRTGGRLTTKQPSITVRRSTEPNPPQPNLLNPSRSSRLRRIARALLKGYCFTASSRQSTAAGYREILEPVSREKG